MLTRQDVQYDLLDCIFSDSSRVFTDPANSLNKLTFSELYVNALNQSTKCSKVLKDKMKETPAFAIEFAKISLLANVGRINTTMACKCPNINSLKPFSLSTHSSQFSPR